MNSGFPGSPATAAKYRRQPFPTAPKGKKTYEKNPTRRAAIRTGRAA